MKTTKTLNSVPEIAFVSMEEENSGAGLGVRNVPAVDSLICGELDPPVVVGQAQFCWGSIQFIRRLKEQALLQEVDSEANESIEAGEANEDIENRDHGRQAA